MNTYTATQISDMLQSDNPSMNLRTVRYYTQMGIIPPLEPVGNKRVYTDTHLHYFRAILMLSKSGESLASIRDQLRELSIEAIANIGNQMPLYQPGRILENQTHMLNDDVFITLSPRISSDLKQKVIDSVSQILRSEENR